jgi:release factor glutamine methyltransferase
VTIAGLDAGLSIAAARRLVAQAFRQHGLDTPDLDARVLIGHALSLDHAALASAAARVLSAGEAAAISAFAVRRLAHEPVARIVGVKEFWGLEFRVTPATLVPRPETETVVEAALAAIDAGGTRTRPLRLADLGTGSGALLLALLSELPQAFGVGTDVSLPALATARANAERLGLAARAHFVACDFGAALHGGFDLVVSNPPYVASGDIAGLAPEVREHDPRGALDGGPQGLDGYRAIAADARRLLAPDGTLVVELGAGQASAVAALLLNGGIVAGAEKHDISGHSRALSSGLSRPWTVSPAPKKALGLLGKSD